MLVNGREIAESIYHSIRTELTKRKTRPHLTVFTCAPNFETRKYLTLKKKKAEEAGLGLNVIEFMPDIKTNEVVQSIKQSAMTADGIVVQLPLPKHIDTEAVLAAVPKNLDVDAVHYSVEEIEILPPVVGAIKAIAEHHGVSFPGKKVVIVGKGRLVGAPAAIWAKGAGGDVTVIDKDTANSDESLKSADIIISGAGVPGLITPEKIKDGVIIFDAGTSEEGGQLRGDCTQECADKAALFTPVPGGIGPITIAILFQNLVKLSAVSTKT